MGVPDISGEEFDITDWSWLAMTAALSAESPILAKSELAPQIVSYHHELLGFVPAISLELPFAS
jgi:hypothetical protein